MYMALSDGMGSGEAAHREAAMTVRLLRQFLQASGVSEESISRAIDQRDRVSEALRSKDVERGRRSRASA